MILDWGVGGEDEAGGSQVQDQPGLNSETLSQKEKEKKDGRKNKGGSMLPDAVITKKSVYEVRERVDPPKGPRPRSGQHFKATASTVFSLPQSQQSSTSPRHSRKH